MHYKLLHGLLYMVMLAACKTPGALTNNNAPHLQNYTLQAELRDENGSFDEAMNVISSLPTSDISSSVSFFCNPPNKRVRASYQQVTEHQLHELEQRFIKCAGIISYSIIKTVAE